MSDSLFLFDNYLTNRYHFANIFVHNCVCYDVYKNDETFKKEIEKKGNYMGCAIGKDNTINHKIIPICIGSVLDILIRGHERVLENVHQLGFFLLSGEYTHYPNFWSNNTTGLCTIKVKNRVAVTWTLSSDGFNFTMKYDKDSRFECTKVGMKTKQREAISIDDFIKINNEIRSQLSLPQIGVEDLEKQCINMIKHPLDMDSLANKIIISTHEILNRVYRSVAFSEDSEVNLKSLANTYMNGVVFFALNNKISVGLEFDCSSKNNKPITTKVSGSKQNSSVATTKSIKRVADIRMKKSEALHFPSDATGLICSINSKELENAGEQVELAVLTIISTPVKASSIILFLRKISEEKEEESVEYQVSIEDFITNFKIGLNGMLKMKKELPMVSFIFFGDLVKIQTVGEIPLKYCTFYEIYISPFEKQHIWKDAFKDYNENVNYDVSAQFIRKITKLQPAKVNVTRINNKNKSAVLSENDIKQKTLNWIAFSRTGGTHTAIIRESVSLPSICRVDSEQIRAATADELEITEEIKKKIPDILAKSNYEEQNLFSEESPMIMKDFENFVKYDELDRERCEKLTGKKDYTKFDVLHKMCNKMLLMLKKGKFVENLIHYNKTEISNVGNLSTNILAKNHNGMTDLILFKKRKRKDENPVTVKKRKTRITFVYKSVPMHDFSKHLAIRRADYFHDFVYTTFGDVGGGTVEDGIVMDSDYAKVAPKQLISTMCKTTIKRRDNLTLQANVISKQMIWDSKNQIFESQILFGYMYSRIPLAFSTNPMIQIEETNIKGEYQYCFSCLNRLGKENICEVSSFLDPDRAAIQFHFFYIEKIREGSKIANFHGQKNVISKIAPLDAFGGVVNGRWVKPAFLYSPQALLGRFSAVQLLSALSDKKCAIQTQPTIDAGWSEIKELIGKTDRTENENFLLNEALGVRLLAPTPIIVHELSPFSRQQGTKRIMRIDLWLSCLGFSANGMDNFGISISTDKDVFKKNELENRESTNILCRQLLPLDDICIREIK